MDIKRNQLNTVAAAAAVVVVVVAVGLAVEAGAATVIV